MDSLIGEGRDGRAFIVSAPAGTGKTTLVEKLLKEFPSIVASISYTTRKPREGEIDGVHYYFISELEFEAKIAAGDFLEYVKLYGTYYGTSRRWIEKQQAEGKHVVLVIDTQGAKTLKGKIDAVSIFILPPSIDVLRSRLIKRETETSDMIDRRIAWAKFELDAARGYDYQILNEDIEIAYEILRSIFIAESHRTTDKER